LFVGVEPIDGLELKPELIVGPPLVLVHDRFVRGVHGEAEHA